MSDERARMLAEDYPPVVYHLTGPRSWRWRLFLWWRSR